MKQKACRSQGGNMVTFMESSSIPQEVSSILQKDSSFPQEGTGRQKLKSVIVNTRVELEAFARNEQNIKLERIKIDWRGAKPPYVMR